MKLFLCLVVSAVAVVETTLLVHKELSCRWVAVSEQCVLHHFLFNAGDADLKSIEMFVDPEMKLRALADVEGIFDVQVYKLAPKTSFLHSITFVPRPNVLESLDAFTSTIRNPTSVRYLEGSRNIKSLSSIPPAFHILSTKQYNYWMGDKSDIWVNFATMVMTPTLMALYLRYKIDIRYPMRRKQ